MCVLREQALATEQPFLFDEAKESTYLSTFYNTHVERFLYSHKLNERMLRLDGDPELFQMLLLLPAPAPTMDKSGDFVDISLQDILGPRLQVDKMNEKIAAETGIPQRNANLSLLSYSFNINPSLRVQLASEMALLQSEAELMKTADETKMPAIARAAASVKKKIDMLSPPSGLVQLASELALHRSKARPS